MPKKKKANQPSTRRLGTIRRIIEMPLLLKQRQWSQSELKNLFEVDGITIRRDIHALSRYWPIERMKIGKEVYYQLPPKAEPKLKRIGRR